MLIMHTIFTPSHKIVVAMVMEIVKANQFAQKFEVLANFRFGQISNNVVCATSKGSDQPAHTCSLIRAFASHLNIL